MQYYGFTESELSILARQCLDRRIADAATLARQVTAWEARRNAAHATMTWRFTTTDARIKRTQLYPVLRLPTGEAAPSPPSERSLPTPPDHEQAA